MNQKNYVSYHTGNKEKVSLKRHFFSLFAERGTMKIKN